jgi:hypothetical protein
VPSLRQSLAELKATATNDLLATAANERHGKNQRRIINELNTQIPKLVKNHHALALANKLSMKYHRRTGQK